MLSRTKWKIDIIRIQNIVVVVGDGTVWRLSPPFFTMLCALFETGGIPEMEVQVRFVGTEFNFLPERV
jgi:hypothetical protein